MRERTKHAVYRIQRNVNNEGRKKKSTEFELVFCEFHKEEEETKQDDAAGGAAAEESKVSRAAETEKKDVVALTQLKITINYNSAIRQLRINYDNSKKNEEVWNHK